MTDINKRQKVAREIKEPINSYGFGRFTVILMLLLGCVTLSNGAIENSYFFVLTLIWTCEESGWANSPIFTWLTMLSGLAVGTLFFGWIGDRYGRKFAIVVTAVLSWYFALLTCSATSSIFLSLMIFFLSTGLCSGRLMSNYSSECFPQKHRARLQVYLGVTTCLGGILGPTIAYFTSFLDWRYYVIIITLPMSVYLFCPLGFPESIPYLQITGNIEAISEIMHDLSVLNGKRSKDRTFIVTRVNESRGNLGVLFHRQHWLMTLTYGIVWITSRFAFITAIVFQYRFDFPKSSKIRCPKNTKLVQPTLEEDFKLQCRNGQQLFEPYIIGSFAELVGLLFTFVFINKINRKTWIVAGFIFTGLILFLQNFCLPVYLHISLAAISRAVTASVFQVLTIYTNEIYPTSLRCSVTGFLNFVSYLAVITIPLTIEMTVLLKPIVMTLIYFIFCIASSVLVWAVRKKKNL